MILSHKNLPPYDVRQHIRSKSITFAGHRKAKIYGRLTCVSGKKMKMENRVFFKTEQEAINYGYRPCGHCMKQAFQEWKKKNLQQTMK